MERVQILSCMGLTDEDPFGGNDPFVIVKDGDSGTELFRTKVKESGGNACEFKDAFVDFAEGQQPRALTVEVWDKDVTDDDLIGLANVPIPNNLERPENARLQLFKQDELVKAGLVQIRWFPSPKQEETAKEAAPEKSKPAEERKEDSSATQEEKKEEEPAAASKEEPKQQEEKPQPVPEERQIPRPPPTAPANASRASRKGNDRFVQILRCTNAVDADPFSGNDPFIVVRDAGTGAELYRTVVKEEAGSEASWDDARVELSNSQTTVRLELWDADVTRDDLIGKVDVIVPHRSVIEQRLHVTNTEAAAVAMLYVSWEIKQPEPRKPLAERSAAPRPQKQLSPRKRKEKSPPKKLKVKLLKKREAKPRKRELVEWEPELTKQAKVSERLLKPLPRGKPEDYKSGESAKKKDGEETRKAKPVTDKFAGIDKPEPKPLKPVFEPLVLDSDSLNKRFDDLYQKSIDRKERTMESLNRKYVRSLEEEPAEQEQIDDTVKRLYDTKHHDKMMNGLNKKYLNKHRAPDSAKLDREGVHSANVRLYSEGLKYQQDVNTKVLDRYLRPRSSPRRTAAEWSSTVERLYTTSPQH